MTDQTLEDLKNETLRQELRTSFLKVLAANKWSTFDDLEVVIQDSPVAIGAYIGFKDRKIVVNASPNIYELIDLLIKKEKLIDDRESFKDKLAEFIVKHEHSHHSLCPRTKENFEMMMDRVVDFLKKREYKKQRIMGLGMYINNLFSDSIINCNNSLKTSRGFEYKEGLDLIYLLMSYSQTKDMNFFQKIFKNKAMGLFIGSNRALCQCPSNMDDKLGKYFARFFPGFTRYRDQLIDVFTGNEKLTKDLLERKISQDGVQELVGRIREEKLWSDMIHQYAKIIYPFLDQENKWVSSSYTKGSGEGGGGQGEESDGKTGNKDSQDNEGGKGKENKDNKDDRKDNGGSGDKDKKAVGNDGKDKNPKPENENGSLKYKGGDGSSKIRDFIRKLLKIDPEQLEIDYNLDELDQLYRRRAGRIAIITEKPGRGNQYEKRLSTEDMPFDEFSTGDVDWGSTRVLTKNGKKTVRLSRGKYPFRLPFQAENLSGGIPDLAFIVDSSSSMEFDPEKGSGDYHLAALAIYSIFNDLEQKGMAYLMNHAIVNFSNVTYFSGWKEYSELRDFKRVLFKYQGGGTVLDPAAVRDLNRTRRDNFICFMLSDSQFNSDKNVDELIPAFEEMINGGGAGVYLFQMKGHSRFSRAIEDMGGGVQLIDSGLDFLNDSLKFTKELYGRAENAQV